MLMPEKIGDFSPSARAAERPSSKLSTIAKQPLEQRAVGVLDRLFFLARGALLVILEIGLAAQGEIAKAIEIRLQTCRRIVVCRCDVSASSDSTAWLSPSPSGLSFAVRFFHVLRMAIKVMSSFCGCEPTKLSQLVDQRD